MVIDVKDLNKLGDEAFESLCKAILFEVIGNGVIPFYNKGKDGGREAKYKGIASAYPSDKGQWDGAWIFQVKYSDYLHDAKNARDYIKSSLNDEFNNLVKYDYIKNGECNIYIYITNVPFSGEFDKGTHDYFKEKIDAFKKENSKIKEIHYWDGEKIKNFLIKYPNIEEAFFPKDINKVLTGLSSLGTKIDLINQSKDKSLEIDAVIEQGKFLIDNHCCLTAIKVFQIIKEKYWDEKDETSPLQKYKILANLGIAKLNTLGAEDNQKLVVEASNHLIEALQYNNENEKALCNFAIGKQLINNHKDAIDTANKILSVNPLSDIGWSIIIKSSRDDEPLETVINKVPIECRELPYTARAIGSIAFKKNNVEQSILWLKKTLASENKKVIEGTKVILSALYIQCAIQEIKSNKISEQGKNNLLEAIEMLSDVWDTYSQTEMRNIKIHLFADRAFSKYLTGKTEEAIKEYDIALEADPTNEVLIINKANLVLRANKITDEIIKSIRVISSKKPISATILLLIDLLVTSGIKKNEIEALTIAENAIKNKIEDLFVYKELLDKLLTLYLNNGRNSDAEKIKNLLKKEFPQSIRTTINEGILICHNDSLSKGLPLLITAYNLSLQDPEASNFFILAETFFKYEIYDKAAKCYEQIVDIDKLDSRLDNMLLSLYQSNQKLSALDVLLKIRNKHGLIKKYTLKETCLLFELGEKEEAIKLIEKLLATDESDLSVKLERAVYQYGLKKYNDVDSFLSSELDYKALSKTEKLSLSSLFCRRNNMEKSLEIAYELWRENINDIEILNQIVGIFLLFNNQISKYWNLEKVSFNSAVYVDWKNEEHCYILEQEKNKTLIPDEINMKSNPDIINALLGKTINEEAEIGEVIGDSNLRKIKRIDHKYAYAYSYAKKYLETKGFKEARYVIGHIDDNITPEQFKSTLEKAIKKLKEKGLLDESDDESF